MFHPKYLILLGVSNTLAINQLLMPSPFNNTSISNAAVAIIFSTHLSLASLVYVQIGCGVRNNCPPMVDVANNVLARISSDITYVIDDEFMAPLRNATRSHNLMFFDNYEGFR